MSILLKLLNCSRSKSIYHASKLKFVLPGAESQIETKPVLPNNVVVTSFIGLELIFDIPISPQSPAICTWHLPGTQNDWGNFNTCIFGSNCFGPSGCNSDYHTLNCTNRDNGTTGIVTYPRLYQSFLEPNKNYTVSIICSDFSGTIAQAQFNFSILSEYWILPLLILSKHYINATFNIK